jgi:predicted transcriptional regulator
MPTSLKVNEDLKQRIQNLAYTRQRSPHWIMLEALRHYVEREEAKEHFKQEAQASWIHYQETGRHLTNAEVQNWMSTWGSAHEKAMPTCHE